MCLDEISTKSDDVWPFVFSHDETRLVSVFDGTDLNIHDISRCISLEIPRANRAEIWEVVFSKDGTKMASISSDKTCKIWDAGTGAHLCTVPGDMGGLRSLMFIRDDTWLASTFVSRTVTLWDIQEVTSSDTPPCHDGPAELIAISDEGTKIASAGGKVRIWDTNTNACLGTIEDKIGATVFSPNMQLALIIDGNIIRVKDISSCEFLQPLKGHKDRVYSTKFSHDGTRTASASADSTIKIWDPRSGKCLRTLESYAYGMVFSHDDTLMASASADSTIKIWDLRSGKCLRTLESYAYGMVFSL